jgi:antitoxin component YwqK of YwqJK toxin-antitoxin module
MSKKTKMPRLNRIDFFRLSELELIATVAHAIEAEPDLSRNDVQEAIVAWSRMAMNVPNGGFTQFFYNHRGDRGLTALVAQLEAFELPKAAIAVRQAQTVFQRHSDKFEVANPWDGLFGSINEFEKIEAAFMRFELRATRAFEKWIRSNITLIAHDESGEPINPKFNGVVEIRQPDGVLSQSLEVKNGKPNGSYLEYFEDGSIRQSLFYKSGKLTGDFWPDGTLKRRESKRGTLSIIEWYHPAGEIWKRYVKNKDGYAVEPIRVYHPNGQLAEELAMVEGVKKGVWVKFFEDGSPKLKAEYADDEKLIVHDAWNDERLQVVKDGTGLFYDDGRSIHWQYDVYLIYNWQRETEFRGGSSHGKVKIYFNGLLWSASQFKNGVEDGESTTYWDNGRIRSVSRVTLGKVVKKKEYPKFDQPEPIVLLMIQADEKLYTAWQHIKVDDYPQPLNLDEIRRELVVPNFLQELYKRNLAGEIKNEYENWYTFNDGIAYFLTVNEVGDVIEAFANGSGVYSAGEWETYPPLLRKLRFTPGRIRNRAVTCRVLARVDHTFKEGVTA